MSVNKSFILTGNFMRPKFTTSWTLGLCFLFKKSGDAWIVDLNATSRIITNLTLKRKTKINGQMRLRIYLTVIKDRVSDINMQIN